MGMHASATLPAALSITRPPRRPTRRRNRRTSCRQLLAGATAVQVGTANFMSPGSSQRIAEEMEKYLRENGIADVKELIGGLRV